MTSPPPSSSECEACQTLKDLGYNEPMRGTDPHHALIAALRDRLEKAEDALKAIAYSEDRPDFRTWTQLKAEARLALKSASQSARESVESVWLGQESRRPDSASKRADKSPTDAKGEG